MVKFEEFKGFHDKHPDLDNSEYYAEFPETNKSTIRSWKNKARQPIEVLTVSTDKTKPDDYDELQNYLIQSLMTQTNTKQAELEGLDNKSKIMILNNRIKVLDENKAVNKPNSPILQQPKPEYITHRKFGLDEYIEFDVQNKEIRMEIPLDVLFDPERNKALGEIK